MVENVYQEFKHNPKSVESFETAITKMYFLNLDCVRSDFEPLFSLTGRPSNLQPQLFRSFLLMSHLKYSSIDQWVMHASSQPILCALVGVSQDDFPGASTHRDFFRRLWLTEEKSRVQSVEKKPRSKHGKEKLPPKHPGIVQRLVDKALSGKIFKQIPERLYQMYTLT